MQVAVAAVNEAVNELQASTFPSLARRGKRSIQHQTAISGFIEKGG